MNDEDRGAKRLANRTSGKGDPWALGRRGTRRLPDKVVLVGRNIPRGTPISGGLLLGSSLRPVRALCGLLSSLWPCRHTHTRAHSRSSVARGFYSGPFSRVLAFAAGNLEGLPEGATM